MKRPRSVKPTQNLRRERDLFAELNEGMNALADSRQGNRTLRSDAVEVDTLPSVTQSKEPRNEQVNSKPELSQEVKDTLRALRRAAKRALELGLQTGTPVYIWKNNQIVDLTKEQKPTKKSKSKRSSHLRLSRQNKAPAKSSAKPTTASHARKK